MAKLWPADGPNPAAAPMQKPSPSLKRERLLAVQRSMSRWSLARINQNAALPARISSAPPALHALLSAALIPILGRQDKVLSGYVRLVSTAISTPRLPVLKVYPAI